jgi:diacylglycerol O-acyltransferase / wax synthase
MATHLSALDATFLELEEADESAHMHIGGIMVFDPPSGGGPPSREDLYEHLSSRLPALPRYSQRLSQLRTGGLSWPQWKDDAAFDLRRHVTRAALPAPGGQAELAQWSSEFFSQRLDRHRPLWEMAIVEGLADGRWALAHKTHHCLVDGVGSVDVAYVLLDTEPGAWRSSWWCARSCAARRTRASTSPSAPAGASRSCAPGWRT